MTFKYRLRAASKVAFFHFLGSLLVAAGAAIVVFVFWYPYPYGELSGGRKLFTILVSVDVVCGPLLTLVLFNPGKSRKEFLLDMSLVVAIQLAAMAYGVHTAYVARPLFLVHEVDRFRVIAMTDYGDAVVSKDIAALPLDLRPSLFSGPRVVGIRSPVDQKERQDVMVESVFGGRDYSQRPEFYVPYDEDYRTKVMRRVRKLGDFLNRYPASKLEATNLIKSQGMNVSEARYLPVLHKEDWIAVLNPKGYIVGFLPGDGFSVP